MRATTFRAMGGSVEVQLPDERSKDAGSIERLFETHERRLSRFLPDSELCALNSSAGARFHASDVLFDAVSEALEWACITDGVFDPTILDALESAGYTRSFDDIAEDGAVAVAERPRTRGAWREIDLDAEGGVISMPAGTRVDLGGIGKGYTVDRAIALLGPAPNAMINASGDLYAAGGGPDGNGWYIGVQDPFALDLDLAVLNVSDCGVATSGSIKRQWTVADTRYHHLIDPREQRSAESDLLTATVVGRTATQSDVLAKTVFLLGSREGMALIERFDGAECMAVSTGGDVMASSGMADYYA